jgi:hypothetical protein
MTIFFFGIGGIGKLLKLLLEDYTLEKVRALEQLQQLPCLLPNTKKVAIQGMKPLQQFPYTPPFFSIN